MKHFFFWPVLALALLAATPHVGGCAPIAAEPIAAEPIAAEPIAASAPTDNRWEKSIAAFEEQDKKSPPPANAALFIGSSSIRFWNTLAQDFPEIPVINRGFGGSQIHHSTRYAERIVLPYQPRLIVMFAGGNDLEAGKTPAQVLQAFREFVDKARAGLPDVSVVYISTNPSIKRWRNREKTVEANRLIAEYMKGQPKLLFIDSYSKMLGPDDQPQKSLLRADGLHLNPSGYKAWTAIVKPQVLNFYAHAKPKS